MGDFTVGKKVSYPCNRQWRTIGLRDVEDHTLSRKSTYRLRLGGQPYAIKMDLLEIGVSVVDWIGLAQDRYRWRALVTSVMNLRVP
jgi:hypothetical protein